MNDEEVWAIIKGRKIIGMKVLNNGVEIRLEDGAILTCEADGQYDNWWFSMSASIDDQDQNVFTLEE